MTITPTNGNLRQRWLRNMERGKYIIFEGGEGCGKSTHSDFVLDYLSKKGISAIKSREPGGVSEAEQIRNVLLSKENTLHPLSELYLFQAARTEFFRKIIIPNLEKGISVLSDRSMYSSEVYQGYAGGIDLKLIKYLNKKSTFGIKPDLTIILDIDSKKGLEKEINSDRMALKGERFHKKVNLGYREIAKNHPNCLLIPYIENKLEEMKSLYIPKINELFGL